MAFVVPVARQIETWNVKLQELKETAQVPSREGLIVGLDTSLLFQVMPESAPTIRQTVGWNYVDLLIIPYFRSALRDVVSGYSVKQVYAEDGRKEIASKVVPVTDADVEAFFTSQADRMRGRTLEQIVVSGPVVTRVVVLTSSALEIRRK